MEGFCILLYRLKTVIQQPDTSGKKSELHQEKRDAKKMAQNF